MEIIQKDNLLTVEHLKEELNDKITDIKVDDCEVVNNSMGYQSSEARFRNLAGSTAWVSSDEVDDIHHLIKKRGCQTTCLFSNQRCHYIIKPVPCDKPFIQTFNKGGDHWIVVSNSMTDSNVVEVCDSGYQLWPYTHSKANCFVKLANKLFMKTESEFIDVRFPDVQKQTDGHNCGFFLVHL